MNRKVKVWTGAAGSVLFFVTMGWVLSAVMELSGGNRWLLRGGMLLLGLVTGFIMHRLLSTSSSSGDEDEAGGDGPAPGGRTAEAVDQAFREANGILRSADVEGGTIEDRPVVLFLGPEGAAKTSVVEQSGVELELLAGETSRDGEPVPTRGANIWLAGETVFVEAGGPVLEDPEAWDRLVAHLRPSRLSAALGRARQPSRLAVVCLPSRHLHGAGGSEAAGGGARRLRERLGALSEDLGVRLPVYVLFTRTDEIPYFRPYVEQLTSEQAGEILGSTLAMEAAESGGSSYDDLQSRRLSGRFDEIFHSLALSRREILRRASDRETKADVYEFPREFRKLRDPAVEFLVELCRPSQLSVRPFLRGFYFTGVRPVVREEGSAAPPGARDLGGGDEPVGATMAFDAEAAMAEARRSAPSPGGGRRRVPQWLFLRGLFRRILLGDRVAMAVTGGGRRVSFLRRSLAGASLGLALLVVVGTTVSFFQNRGLHDRVAEAMDDVDGLTRVDESMPPGEGALAELDTLGQAVDELRSWETDGPPWRYRWFLYSGSDVLPPARDVYFHRFWELLGRETHRSLTSSLRVLSDTADADYPRVYSALKAHLLMTREPERSSADFLAPVLMEHWPHREGARESVRSLVRSQFRTYGRELKHENPYDLPEESDLVFAVRDFLEEFGGVDRFYQLLVSNASSTNESVRFGQEAPDAGGVLQASHVVPGAYTREGWRHVHHSLSNVDSLLANERWVTDQEFTDVQLEELAEEARQRYVRDYVGQWQDLLSSADVRGLSSVSRAARTLADLSARDSPVLRLLAVVARHTAVDSTVRGAFQPVHSVAPPDTVDRFIVQANQKYVDALGALGSALDELATSSGGGDGARGKAVDAARSVEDVVSRMSRQSFSPAPEAAPVGSTLASLLGEPGRELRRMLERLPAQQVNGRAREFCQAFGSVTSAYPFEAFDRTDRSVSLEELDSALMPGESQLWSFYDDALSELLEQQGSRWVARSGASLQPTGAFLAFFNRAASISRAFYTDQGEGPAVSFRLRLETSSALPEVRARIDGQTYTWTRTMSQLQAFRWVGERARSAEITGTVNDRETTLVDPDDGTWSLFRLFEVAELEHMGGSRYRVRWPAEGRPVPVEGELILGTDVPIFDPSFLRFDCVSTVAR